MLITAVGPSRGQATDGTTVPRKLVYSKPYTAEQVLNGETPGRKPSPPPLPVTFDTNGFAKQRLFHVPPVGVHPRVLFGPTDIPDIRSRLARTETGRQMMAFIKQQLERGIDKPGTWQNDLMVAGEKGDLATFKKLYRPLEGDVTVVGSEIAPASPYKPATKWHQRDVFDQEIELKAFLDLLDNKKEDGQRVAKVLTTMAHLYEPVLDAVDRGPFAQQYWWSVHDLFGWQFFTYGYDWAYNFMTPEQQATVRHTISRMTSGRYTLGMDLPSHWRNWNFIGMALYQPLQALSIEGEEGYDPRVYKRGVEVVRDFLAYAINPSGMAHESVGYHSAGMQHMSHVMLAMANRGDNFFTQSHYRAAMDQWYLQTLQPYGHEWFSDGDLGNFAPGTEGLAVAKYFYPNDKKLDYVFQNIVNVQKNDFASDFFIEAMLVTANDPMHAKDGSLVDYRAGAVLGIPNTYTDEHRGVVITRSAWTPEALYMNFECHPDTTFASHDHADRGRFVLSGVGRNWAWQDSRPHDSGDTSVVTIDGVGEGFFPPPAKYLGMVDKPEATFAACDAKYAYDWRWLKEVTMWDPNDPRLKTRVYASYLADIEKVDHAKVEYDPSPNVVGYYEGYLAGNPLMWGNDSWVPRMANNPVLRAFRTAGIVRGAHPYAVVADDIQKDNAEHLYTWLMSLEMDILLVDQTVHDGMRDIILGDKVSNRRLLVRVLNVADASGAKPAFAEHYRAAFKLQGNAPQAPEMYRLVIPSTSVAPDYKVMMFAFHEGDPLPISLWNADHSAATVEWRDQKDLITFTSGTQQKTHIGIVRSGKQVLSIQ